MSLRVVDNKYFNFLIYLFNFLINTILKCFLFRYLFSYGLTLCKLLQSKAIDLKEFVGLVKNNVTILKNLIY